MCQGRDKVPFGSRSSRETGAPLFYVPVMKWGVCLKVSRATNCMGSRKPCLTLKEGAPKSHRLANYGHKKGDSDWCVCAGERSCHGLVEMSRGVFQRSGHEPVWDFCGLLGGLPCGTVALVELLSLFYSPL